MSSFSYSLDEIDEEYIRISVSFVSIKIGYYSSNKNSQKKKYVVFFKLRLQ